MSNNSEKLDTLILIGEVRFGKEIERDQIQEALDYYKRIGAKEKLEEIGHLAIENGYILIALNAFKLAKVVLPEKELMILAGRYSGSPYVLEIYKALGATDKLVEAGRAYLEQGKIIEAIYSFDAAGTKISKEIIPDKMDEYIAEGNRLEEAGRYREAMMVYRALGSKSDLLAMLALTDEPLDKHLFKGFVEALEVIFKKPLKDSLSSEEIKMIANYGDQYLELGYYDEGEVVYKAIGEKMPADKLVACGNKLLFGLDKEDTFDLCSRDAFRKGYNALRKAGLTPSKENIIEAGDNYLECLSIAQAVKAYEKVGAENKLCDLLKRFAGGELRGLFEEDIAMAIIRVRNKKIK